MNYGLFARLKSSIFVLFLATNLLFCVEKNKEAEPELKISKEQTKKAIDQTIKLTRAKLDSAGRDPKKFEAVIVNFVSRLEDLEVDETSWPEVSSLIKDLDDQFIKVSKDNDSLSKSTTQAIDKLREFLKLGNENFAAEKASHKEEKNENARQDEHAEKKDESVESEKAQKNEKDYEIEMASGDENKTDPTFSKKQEVDEQDNFDVSDFITKTSQDLVKVDSKDGLEAEVSKLVSFLSKQILTDKEGSEIGVLFDDKLSSLLMKYGLEEKLADELSDLYARLKIVWPFGKKIEIEKAQSSENVEVKATESASETKEENSHKLETSPENGDSKNKA